MIQICSIKVSSVYRRHLLIYVRDNTGIRHVSPKLKVGSLGTDWLAEA